MFSSKNGISSDLIPEAIIIRSLNPDRNKLKTTFGSYGQVYICTTNITNQRTVGDISMQPENEWGGHYFMLLATGKQLHTYICTEIPINKQVMQRVDDLATTEKQPDMTKGYPIFEWISGIPITDQANREPDNEEELFHSKYNNYDIKEYGEGEVQT